GTYYDTGLGACGITNNNGDFIAAIAHDDFDNFPGYDRVNPNHNPICGKKVRATWEGKSVDVVITDRCGGCAPGALDFSPAAFAVLASSDVGRLKGMTWTFI
ncbi:barwin-like endoglucanase, partial [Panus rudis PR-1116 ss-1]